MRHLIATGLLLLASPALAQTVLSPADQTAAFRAAGFTRVGSAWHGCDDPGTASYTPGAIESVVDLNGDGRPEAVITESSTYCYGMEGQAFSLVGKQADGSWKLIIHSSGIASFLADKGPGGWPDLEIGGPGFCFSAYRWNGREYEYNRDEYDGKPCKAD